ncbi:MAG: hypothetical protein WEB03_12205 [Nitriliruptor sp.]|uniref:hypothetical protein n=1 Tax=Nitriliruptor sp. TaxID=2448056 RepID=UPI0034A0AE30
MGRRGVAVWAAWALSFGGGIALLGAAYLVARVDLVAACATAAGCASALSTTVRVLAFGGITAATIGGVVATVLTVRGSSVRRDPDVGHAPGGAN